jgi:chaperonin cofactor prefoldin
MENMARLNNLRRQIQVVSGEIVGLDARIDELKRLHEEMEKPQPNDDEVQQ